MRDVKCCGQPLPHEKVQEFYLNYEGCKVIQVALKAIKIFKFYLNYEGCKEKLGLPDKFAAVLFYLNYEGCKVLKGEITYVQCGGFYLNYEGCKEIFS
ncbi:MAG: hypothetical protein XD37_2166 [Thermoanaerobacter thermocopriae]|nr:MAG: hypothetical protein XD37_2166 [Thermoanaerobacter thermocopriae]